MENCFLIGGLNGVTFYSGCMLYPEGKIKNTTPFGGWAK